MFAGAKNGYAAGMDYIRFGRGEKVLIMLPGLGDGLQTVKGTALPMALMYRLFARKFTVYMFSRLKDLPVGHTTRDMARDLANAMEELSISKADILGVSMGGMISQWLAIDYPAKVGRLVLAVTSPRPNGILTESVAEWVAYAEQSDHTALMDSNVRRIYSAEYYRLNKWLIPLIGALTKPRSYDRFLIQAQACLRHDAFEELKRVQAPTLVIGGEKDVALGAEASRELAAQIPGAALKMYRQWGHGLYEEAKDFNRVVMDFCLSDADAAPCETILSEE